MKDALRPLRERIATLDEQLLRLVAERLDVVREVGRVKADADLPVRSYEAEDDVLRRFRRLGATLGLDDHVAERIAGILIGEAVRRQEIAAAAPGPGTQRVLLVGGAGKMGRWLARFFAERGHAVASLDPSGPVPGAAQPANLHSGVADADVVIVATPLAPGRAVLADILAQRPRALVADIFSLKSHVLDLLQGAAREGLRVASLHPLFGPTARTLSGRVMAVCDCGNAAAAAEAAALFAGTQLTITHLKVARHDEYMQFVLGLSHLVAILFFTTLTGSGRSYDDLARMASTTFLKEARTAAEVARENAHLYYEIQHLNHHSAELFALVRSSLEAIERAALGDEPRAFTELMERGRVFFPASLPAELA